MFKKLILGKWRQFDNIDISFHPHLTILTGANGAGKTTLLNIFESNSLQLYPQIHIEF